MNKSIKTRNNILNQAIFIASTIGYEALTIGKLANIVGMSKSGLFAHFKSKEKLQVELLKAVAIKFVEIVTRPAMKSPKGIPRLNALAENLLNWSNADFMPGGCLLWTATVEFDDRPGPARDFLVKNQKKWIKLIADTAKDAIEAGQFKDNLNVNQFAYEFQSIFPSYQFASGLLNDPTAEDRARVVVEKLIEQSRK